MWPFNRKKKQEQKSNFNSSFQSKTSSDDNYLLNTILLSNMGINSDSSHKNSDHTISYDSSHSSHDSSSSCDSSNSCDSSSSCDSGGGSCGCD